MSDALDAVAPIKEYEHLWHPWTRKELADLSAHVECSERARLVMSVSMMLMWCNSIKGTPQALAVAGRITVTEVEALVPMTDQEDLVAKLVNRCYGEADTEPVQDDGTTDGDESSADPLAQANGG